MSPENFTADYEKYSDVMFLSIADTPTDAVIETMEVGDKVGFPGQIVARYNAVTGELYGVIIERYSAVERKINRDEAKHNAKQALVHLLERVLAALSVACPGMHLQTA